MGYDGGMKDSEDELPETNSVFAARLFIGACVLGLFSAFVSYAGFGATNIMIVVAMTAQFWFPCLFAAYAIGRRGVSPFMLGMFVIAEVIALVVGYGVSGRMV